MRSLLPSSWRRRLGLVLLVTMLASLFPAVAASASTPSPGTIYFNCRYDSDWSTITHLAPGQVSPVNASLCSRVRVISGSVSVNGTTRGPGTYTISSAAYIRTSVNAEFALYRTGATATFDLTVHVAPPLADPSGSLLGTNTVSLDNNASVFSVTANQPLSPGSGWADHALAGDTNCLVAEGDHVYTPLTVYISQPGQFTFRAISSTPASDYIDPSQASSPMDDPFLAVYRTFDPTQPDQNVVGCNDDYDNTAHYAGASTLSDGTVVEGHLPAFEANFTPGIYTLVLSTYCDISAANWQSGAAGQDGCNPSFTPGSETATYQLWGPTGALTVVTPPTITSPGPAGTLTDGQTYSYTNTASSNAPTTWSISAGSLPPGLTLDPSTGIITGTATTPGSYPYTVTVSNGAGTDSASYTQVVTAVAPHITSPAPATTIPLGAAYAATATATGSAPVTWTVSSGTLPTGLTLDPATGIITGTTTTPGTYAYTLTAANTAGTDSAAYTQTVPTPAPAAPSPSPVASSLPTPVAAPAPVASSLPTPVTTPAPVTGPVVQPHPAAVTLRQGSPFALTVTTTGSGPLTWTVTHGSLPPGMTLDATSGIVSGTPQHSGTYAISVMVSSATGSTTSDYTFRVLAAAKTGEAPVIASHCLSRSLTVGTAYASTVKATGTPTRYTVTSGRLPAGLTLDTQTGLVSGIPTRAETARFAIQAFNRYGTAHRTLELTVRAAAPGELPIVSG